jgi:hypothetical protein
MLGSYRVYKVDGKVIGDYVTQEEARRVASKHKGARVATHKENSKGWNYSAMQGKFAF